LPFLRIAIRQIGRLDKRSIGLDGVQVAANVEFAAAIPLNALLEKEPQSPLFPASIGKTGKLSRRPLVRTDAADMLKRRLKQAGLPAHCSPHSFRATGITNFLENDGTLEAAQRIAGHADSRTTKLYDRRGQKVLLEDMERIRY